MAVPLTTGQMSQLTTLRGIHMVIFNDWETRPRVGRSIFKTYESNQYREHTQTVGGVGLMSVKTEGNPIDYDSINEGFTGTFTHVDYSKGLRLTREMMREELYGVVDDLGVELSQSAVATEETILADNFNNGFSGGSSGPDGAQLFSTSHIRENGTTYANTLSNSSDISETSLQQVMINFRNTRTGGGLRMVIPPKVLLIPPDLQFKAMELTKSKFGPEDDTNRINYLSEFGLQVKIWDYLTDTDSWFVLADQSNHKLLHYTREELWTEHIYDFDTKDYKLSGMFSLSSGWADPRGTYGVQGA